MKNTKRTCFCALCMLLWSCQVFAQQKDTTNYDDFGAYGDADTKVTKSYCTQKVNYLSPSKLISLGYELQAPFHINSTRQPAELTRKDDIELAHGLRVMYSTPIISRNNLIVNASISHWETGYASSAKVPNSDLVRNLTDNGLRSTSLQGTVFKPFSEKNFMILQAQADINGNYTSFAGISSKTLTYSATAIYGWKKSDNLMWGVGASRTYRLGQLIYVPVLLWNKTFNEKWGAEVLLPARALVRRNFGTTSLLTAGVELEGNTYHLNGIGFLRRGEIKPRLTYERQLKNFIWLSAQAGLRYNARFDVYANQNPKGDDPAVFKTHLNNPFYFNIGINLVSP
jgi:Domain of unknown function (DUF6268)